MIMIVDGAKARFWHDSWLDGEAPRTSLHICLSSLGGRRDQSDKNFKTIAGCTL